MRNVGLNNLYSAHSKHTTIRLLSAFMHGKLMSRTAAIIESATPPQCHYNAAAHLVVGLTYSK